MCEMYGRPEILEPANLHAGFSFPCATHKKRAGLPRPESKGGNAQEGRRYHRIAVNEYQCASQQMQERRRKKMRKLMIFWS